MARIVQSKFPRSDKRLLGVWKSDKKRTLAEWIWRKGIPLKRKRLAEKFLFRTIVTYTPTKVIYKAGSIEITQRYETLASDDTSVAIKKLAGVKLKNVDNPWARKAVEQIHSKDKIAHIHFTENHFWISWGKTENFSEEFASSNKSNNCEINADIAGD